MNHTSPNFQEPRTLSIENIVLVHVTIIFPDPGPDEVRLWSFASATQCSSYRHPEKRARIPRQGYEHYTFDIWVFTEPRESAYPPSMVANRSIILFTEWVPGQKSLLGSFNRTVFEPSGGTCNFALIPPSRIRTHRPASKVLNATRYPRSSTPSGCSYDHSMLQLPHRVNSEVQPVV